MPGFEHINQPYWFERGAGLSPQEFGLAAARELEAKILELGPHRVAAFIGEPVQGSGGVIIPPDSYWPEIQRICDQYGILLISDEVICGFGRTGQWFGCEHFGTRPDLMTMAKALSSGYLPIGGVMVGERVAQQAHRQRRRVRAWLHLLGASGVQRGGAGQSRRSSSASGWWSMSAIPPGPTCSSAGPSWRRIRWWARRVAWDCSGALELVQERAGQPTRPWFEPRGKVGERCRDNAIANGLRHARHPRHHDHRAAAGHNEAEIDELVEKAWRTLDMTLAGLKQDGWL